MKVRMGVGCKGVGVLGCGGVGVCTCMCIIKSYSQFHIVCNYQVSPRLLSNTLLQFTSTASCNCLNVEEVKTNFARTL